MSYLKDREVWLPKTPTGNPPAGYFWKFIKDGGVVVRDSDGVDYVTVNKAGDTMTGLLRATAGINFEASGGDTLSQFEEEQSFTPIIEGASTSGTGTYTVQFGRYTRIGNYCFYRLWVQWTAHNGTGGFRIGGLPFVQRDITNGTSMASGVFVGTASYTGIAFFQHNPNSDRVAVGTQNNGASSSANVEDHQSGLILISGHYPIEP